MFYNFDNIEYRMILEPQPPGNQLKRKGKYMYIIKKI